MVDWWKMVENPICVGISEAVDALEQEAQRQTRLREDLFGAGDSSGAKAAGDLAFSYRAAAEFLRKRMSCLGRKQRA